MAVEYALYTNHLTEEDNFSARIQNPRNKSIAKTIEQMTDEGSILTDVESNTVIHAFFKHLAKGLKDNGECLQSEYLNMSLSMKGVFDDENDTFDPTRHEIVLNITPGEFLTKVLGEIELKKIKAAPSVKPLINKFYDVFSKTTTQMSVPGMVELKGENLKVDEEAADEGVFLINKADSSETKVTDIHTNKPGTIQFVAPTGLGSGTYEIEVRNRPYRLKDLRTGRLATTVTVA